MVTLLYRRTAGNQNKPFIACRIAVPTSFSAPSSGKLFTSSMRVMWTNDRETNQLDN
jgi:hypothetical protein